MGAKDLAEDPNGFDITNNFFWHAYADVLKSLPLRHKQNENSTVPQLLHIVVAFFPRIPHSTFLSGIDSSKVVLPPQVQSKCDLHPTDIFASISKFHLNYTIYSNTSDPRKFQNISVEYSDRQVMQVREVYYAMGNELDR